MIRRKMGVIFSGETSFGKEVSPDPFKKTLVFLTIGNR